MADALNFKTSSSTATSSVQYTAVNPVNFGPPQAAQAPPAPARKSVKSVEYSIIVPSKKNADGDVVPTSHFSEGNKSAIYDCIPLDFKAHECAAGKMGYRTQSWKQRWFSIDGRYVRYYKDQSAFSARKSAKGEMRLGVMSSVHEAFAQVTYMQANATEHCREEDIKVLPDRPNLMELRNMEWSGNVKKPTRTFYLSFSTSEDRDAFMAVCNHNLSIIRTSDEGQKIIRDAAMRKLLKQGKTEEEAEKVCQGLYGPTTLSELERLLKVSKTGMREEMQCMQRQGINIHFLPDSFGSSTLIQAASVGNISMVEFLLNHLADVDQQTIIGNTALHIALRSQHWDVAKLLVERGANTHLANASHETPRDIAKKVGRPDFFV